jgi:MYXO-CTERM domain-containing protein
MQGLPGPLRPLTPRISFDVAFADVPEVDATIAVVIVDRAGNESLASDPIELRWSGCTVFGFDDRCLSQDNGCSAAGTRKPAGGLPYALPSLALVALAARRSSHTRRR